VQLFLWSHRRRNAPRTTCMLLGNVPLYPSHWGGEKICYNFSFRLRLAISGHRVRTSLNIHGDDELLRPCGHPHSDLYTSASAVIQGTIAFGSLNGNDCDRIMVAIPEVGSTCQ
jgi:hypothetical protein